MAKINMQFDNGLEQIKLNKTVKKESKKNKETKEKTKKKQKGQILKEMKLVTWPTGKSVVKYSIATIIMIIVLALFFIGISALFDLLYALVQGWIG